MRCQTEALPSLSESTLAGWLGPLTGNVVAQYALNMRSGVS